MNDEMIITLPGGLKVVADFGGFEIKTDQPVQGGGDGSAPSPFLLFLASLGTCAGAYVLAFCKQRDIPTEGIRLIQSLTPRATGGIDKVAIDIEVPASFPEKYLGAIAHAASACAVKKALEHPPAFEVKTVVKPS